jgi:hypothetical protein
MLVVLVAAGTPTVISTSEPSNSGPQATSHSHQRPWVSEVLTVVSVRGVHLGLLCSAVGAEPGHDVRPGVGGYP